MADLSPLDIAFFWSKVDGSTEFQCWPWRGRTNQSGYGRFRADMAHRVAYELVHGSIPDGLIIRHRCDNPCCCNPLHLVRGTHADNSADAIERNRLATDQRNGNAKLTADQITYIRQNPDRRKQSELSRQFGVANSTISMIRSGKRRGHDATKRC